MAREIGLVSAPRARRGGILQAREQFDPSPLFRRARDYCERQGWEWYILSASHGLLTPRQVIGDDLSTVHTMTTEARLEWARSIGAQLEQISARSAQPAVFALLAGHRYAELLERAAPRIALATPLAGLDFVARLRWFDERLRVRSRMLGSDNAQRGTGGERT